MDLKKLHCGIAVFLLLFSFIIYFASMAPTLSFWDCGEFIATSVIMGVPHPPGTPLYLLIGHMFSLIPFGDIGARVNLISPIVSALAVMLLYLTAVKLIRLYRGKEENLVDALIIYGGSAVGALTFAFTHSHWFNAVEAEVYASSIFLTAIVIYLIMVWAERADDPHSDRLLLIIAYIIGLAIGVHLENLLTIPVIALVIYFRKFKFSWSTFFATVGLSIVAFMTIYLGIIKWLPATAHLSVVLPLLIVGAIVLGCYYAIKARNRITSLIMITLLLLVIGNSTSAYIFIRSSHNPPIDENNPDTVERFLSYINREQYGDIPMFTRRWNNDPNYTSESDYFWRYQINYMYNRYFLWNFVGMEGDFQGAGVKFSEFYALPLILGLWGVAHHALKDRRRALVVLALFFMTGLAIVIYVNQDNPQPRERDYSYVGSFYAFAIWIAIGAEGVLSWLSGLKQKANARGLVLGGLALLLLALPINMVAKSFPGQNRRGNYVAWDYSRNMLETCAPNAVMFTNGDNDTFPLWYLQEVMGVRKDVRIVNLSLLNTGWYILQLKHQDPKVPITFSDDYINRYLDQHDSEALRSRYWPKNDPRKQTVVRVDGLDGKGGFDWDIPATMHVPTGANDSGEPNFLRVQDIMIIDIIRAAKWKRPVYFAVTVSSSNMLNLRDHLTMEGLAFRVNPETGREVDPELMRYNLLEKYRNHYRNLDNPNIHYDDNVYRLLQNYRSAYLQLATYYLERNQSGTVTYTPTMSEPLRQFDQVSDRDKVLFILDNMQKNIPEEVMPINSDEITLHLGRLYMDLGRPEELRKRVDRLASGANLSVEQRFRYGAVYLQWLNDQTAAQKQFDEVLKLDSSPDMKLEVAGAYNQMQMRDKADKLLTEVSSGPMTPELEVKLGTSLIQMERYDQAEGIFQAMMLRNPNDGSAVGGLLMVYEKKGDWAAAARLLENWTTAHPTDSQAKARLEQYRARLAAGGP
jgi:tetratricopeptide (TPR) repeat protein